MNRPLQTRRLQLLLHDNFTNEEGVREAKRIVEEVGMKVSGQGAATLSARISDGDFKKLFAEASGDQPLAVPPRLKPFVSSISEAPAHLSF